MSSSSSSADPDPARRFALAVPRRGKPCHIRIHVPAGEAPAAGWPALLLLDGEGCFETAVEAMQRMGRRPDATGVSPMVLIGLSVPDRARDFGVRGDASDFAEFLEHDCLTAIADHAPVDPQRISLFGHSLGGYCALWMLAHRPHLFAAIAAISPSIWWDPEALSDSLSRAPLGRQRVLICVGEWEDDLPPWQAARADSDTVRQRRAERHMIARARAMADRLAARLGTDTVHFRLLAEEDHASIISAAVPRALRLASG